MRLTCIRMVYQTKPEREGPQPADKGGSQPINGRHSTMERPDSVNRVTPPMTVIAPTSPATTNSQVAISRRGRSGISGYAVIRGT